MRRPAVRVALAVLAALNLGWGGWALGWPRHFFAEFPGLGHRWTAAYPPYNEHLVSDLGATFVTLGLLLALATVLDDRRVRAVVLLGVLAFNGLHLGFHLTHRGALGGVDLGASLASLVAGVLAPLALLAAIAGKPAEHGPPAAPAGSRRRGRAGEHDTADGARP